MMCINPKISGGAQVKSLPVTFRKGAACIAAILRLKFQAGVALKVFGTGFDFESGVFFDPLQYKACITDQPTQPCPLAFTENFYEEIGAYARAVVDLDFAKLSAGPTAVSTFFTGALPSQCLSTSVSSASASSKMVISTTAPPAKETTSSAAGGKNNTATGTKSSAGSTTTLTPLSTGVSKINGTSGNNSSVIATSISGGVFPQTTGTGASGTGASNLGTRSAGGIYTIPTGVTPYANTTSVAIPTTSSDITLTTRVISTVTYTITSCLSNVAHCPASLQSPVVQTKTIVAYTTVCPVTQTEFPTAPSLAVPASAAPAAASITAAAAFITPTPNAGPVNPGATNAVSFASCEAPIITTFDVYATLTKTVTITVSGPSLTTTQLATVNVPYQSKPYQNTDTPPSTTGSVSTITSGAPGSYPVNAYTPSPASIVTTTAKVPFYPLGNSTSQVFPTASGISGVGSISGIVGSTAPVSSTAPVASTAPMYEAPGGYNYGGVKLGREASGPAPKLVKKTAGAESVVPSCFMTLGCLMIGVFVLL
jgi:hypothetical protein